MRAAGPVTRRCPGHGRRLTPAALVRHAAPYREPAVVDLRPLRAVDHVAGVVEELVGEPELDRRDVVQPCRVLVGQRRCRGTPRLSRSWSSFDAPRIGSTKPGRSSSQRERDLRRLWRRSRARPRRRSARCRACGRRSRGPTTGPRRPAPGTCRSGSPPPAAPHAVTARPSACAIGSSSRSAVRSARLYWICSATNGDQSRSSAIVVRLRDLPRRPVRHADVQHLAEAHLVVERAHGLLDRRQRVARMCTQRMSMWSVREPPQARVERPRRGSCAVAGRVGVGRVHVERVLRREHEPVAAALEQLAEDLLARAVRVPSAVSMTLPPASA